MQFNSKMYSWKVAKALILFEFSVLKFRKIFLGGNATTFPTATIFRMKRIARLENVQSLNLNVAMDDAFWVL